MTTKLPEEDYIGNLELLEQQGQLKEEIELLISELKQLKVELPLRTRERIETSDTLMRNKNMSAGAINILVLLKDDLYYKKKGAERKRDEGFVL